MKITHLLATTVSLAAVSATLAVALPTPAPAPVAAPVVTSPIELLLGDGVNDVGGTYQVFMVDTPWFSYGTWSYLTASGFEYGGTLNFLYVDGNSAYVSGEITFSNGPPVGFGVLMKVTDNGGFFSSTPDTQSPILIRPPGTGTQGGAEDPEARAFIDTLPTFEFTSGNMLVAG